MCRSREKGCSGSVFWEKKKVVSSHIGRTLLKTFYAASGRWFGGATKEHSEENGNPLPANCGASIRAVESTFTNPDLSAKQRTFLLSDPRRPTFLQLLSRYRQAAGIGSQSFMQPVIKHLDGSFPGVSPPFFFCLRCLFPAGLASGQFLGPVYTVLG